MDLYRPRIRKPTTTTWKTTPAKVSTSNHFSITSRLWDLQSAQLDRSEGFLRMDPPRVQVTPSIIQISSLNKYMDFRASLARTSRYHKILTPRYSTRTLLRGRKGSEKRGFSRSERKWKNYVIHLHNLDTVDLCRTIREQTTYKMQDCSSSKTV